MKKSDSIRILFDFNLLLVLMILTVKKKITALQKKLDKQIVFVVNNARF